MASRGAVAGFAAAAAIICTVMTASCGAPPPAIGVPVAQPAVAITVTPVRATPDSTASALIPVGYGSLKQDDIAITLQPSGVRVTAIPLDESVIRVLAPDSYRALHATEESKHQQIVQRAAVRGVRDPRVWYVTFTGLVPDARFVPTDMTVTSGGRDYRPLDVIPLTPGFAEERVQPREIQRCLLLFDQPVDVSQPLTVSMGTERNTDWENTLQKIETARAEIRARAASRP